MPDTVSLERRVLLRAFGAEVVLTPGPKGMKAAIAKAQRVAGRRRPNSYMLQQFDNPANPKIHFETTGPEIWEDTDGKVDILISGVGTGGTLTGVSEYIKPKKPSFKAIAVEPVESPVLSGGQPRRTRFRASAQASFPAFCGPTYIDEVVQVSTRTIALVMARRLASEEGLLMGISSGAAVVAALRVGAARRECRQADRRGAARRLASAI